MCAVHVACRLGDGSILIINSFVSRPVPGEITSRQSAPGPDSPMAGPLRSALLAALLALLTVSVEALSTSSTACGVSAEPKYLPLPRCAPTNKTLEDAKRGAQRAELK